MKQQLWHFGLAPGKVAAFWRQYHWRELEQMGGRKFTERYIQLGGGDPPVLEIERFVYAEKL